MVCSSSKLSRDYLIQHPHYRWSDPRSRSHSYRLSDSSVQTSHLVLCSQDVHRKLLDEHRTRPTVKMGQFLAAQMRSQIEQKVESSCKKKWTLSKISPGILALWSKLRLTFILFCQNMESQISGRAKPILWAIFILEGWPHTLSKQKTAKSLSSALENSLISWVKLASYKDILIHRRECRKTNFPGARQFVKGFEK